MTVYLRGIQKCDRVQTTAANRPQTTCALPICLTALRSLWEVPACSSSTPFFVQSVRPRHAGVSVTHGRTIRAALRYLPGPRPSPIRCRRVARKRRIWRRCDSAPCRHATTCTSPGLACFRSARLTTSTARSLLIDSWNRHLPTVAFPFRVLLALVGQANHTSAHLGLRSSNGSAFHQLPDPSTNDREPSAPSERKRHAPQSRQVRAFHPATRPVSEFPVNCRPFPKPCCHYKTELACMARLFGGALLEMLIRRSATAQTSAAKLL